MGLALDQRQGQAVVAQPVKATITSEDTANDF